MQEKKTHQRTDQTLKIHVFNYRGILLEVHDANHIRQRKFITSIDFDLDDPHRVVKRKFRVKAIKVGHKHPETHSSTLIRRVGSEGAESHLIRSWSRPNSKMVDEQNVLSYMTAGNRNLYYFSEKQFGNIY